MSKHDSLNSWNLPRLVHAYRQMAEVAKCRPEAPSGIGGWATLNDEELGDAQRLGCEALRFAKHFSDQEDEYSFHIGCTNGSTLIPTAYLIQAARYLCCGHDFNPLAEKLISMATAELKKPTAFPEYAGGVNLADLGIYQIDDYTMSELRKPGPRYKRRITSPTAAAEPTKTIRPAKDRA